MTGDMKEREAEKGERCKTFGKAACRGSEDITEATQEGVLSSQSDFLLHLLKVQENSFYIMSIRKVSRFHTI